MKKYIADTLLALILVMSFNSCSGKDHRHGDNNTLIAGQLPSHPRILLLDGEEEGIRRTIANDDNWYAVHTFILSESNKLFSKPSVERVLVGRRLLDKSREALRRIFFLSYSYRMTGDEKYFVRARQELLAVSNFTDWNPSHFLDVAEMTMAASIGYDWLYANLQEEDRNTIRNAIVEKGLKPSLQSAYNSWLKNSNNWNQVCNAGMTFGALAVYEDEKTLATQVIERAVSSIKLPEADYNPDGAYPEGYGYWGYGTSFNVMFLSAMKRAFGSAYDLSAGEGFTKTALYLENMIGPTGLPFNYTDCGTSAGMNPAMFWFADSLNNPSVLWSEKYLMVNKGIPNDRLLPAVLIWGAGLPLSKISAPSGSIWVGQGKNPVALMRTSWEDPNAIYLALKAGSPSVNHAHMDVGSFVMDANGVRWAIDFGMQDYNSLESAGVDLWNMSQNSQRWSVFRYNNMAHNTLTVNNQYQKVAGKASIIAYSGEAGMINAVTDLSSVYSGLLSSAMRGVAIVDNKYVLVRDEIKALQELALVRWNMVTPATVSISGSNSASLVKNGKKLTLKVLSPASVTMKTWSTVPPNTYDALNPGTTMVGFEMNAPANENVVIIVALLPEDVTENQAVTAKTLSEWPKSK